MIKTCILFAFAFWPAVVSAQSEAASLSEVFGGFSVSKQSDLKTFYGWDASFSTYLIDDWFAVVADFSHHRISEDAAVFNVPITVGANIFNYRFGPKLVLHTPRVTPFAQALLGGTRIGVGV